MNEILSSILIQTLNEEENLPSCLSSVAWSDDIVVLDSLSTDKTVEIARTAGARVFQRPYDGRANNQNWAVENIEFKYLWVFHLDADEIVPQELAAEIKDVISDLKRGEVAYRIRFKNIFFGTWIKRSSMYPSWIPRLWQPDKIRWRRGANPVAIIDGPTGRLKNHFIHYSFSKGFASWFDKHNKYSDYEAAETIKELEQGRVDWSGLLAPDPIRRRIALKHFSFRMPCRPLLKFIYLYFIRRGFLDGRPGLTYCILQAIYEYMIHCKVKEHYLRARGELL
jgi:glycosyltransferase involved in cell wall biosynthesis